MDAQVVKKCFDSEHMSIPEPDPRHGGYLNSRPEAQHESPDKRQSLHVSWVDGYWGWLRNPTAVDHPYVICDSHETPRITQDSAGIFLQGFNRSAQDVAVLAKYGRLVLFRIALWIIWLNLWIIYEYGWWFFTYPSEKYEFVNCDDYSQLSGKNKVMFQSPPTSRMMVKQ